MTENEYIAKLRAKWPTEKEEEVQVCLDHIALADEAVQHYPSSTQLWCIRGDLIQLGSADSPHELGEALSSYRRDLEIDPTCAEAYEEIGHFLDAVEGQLEEAKQCFKEKSGGVSVPDIRTRNFCVLSRFSVPLCRVSMVIRAVIASVAFSVHDSPIKF